MWNSYNITCKINYLSFLKGYSTVKLFSSGMCIRILVYYVAPLDSYWYLCFASHAFQYRLWLKTLEQKDNKDLSYKSCV